MSTAQDRATSGRVVEQWNEMAQTSDNFQQALTPDQMADLRDTRNRYFDAQAKEARIAELERERKKLGSKDARKEAELKGQIEALEKEVAPSRKVVKDQLGDVFDGWTSMLSAEVALDAGGIAANRLTAESYAKDAKRFRALKGEDVDAYARRHAMAKRAEFQKTKQYATYEALIKAEIAKRERTAREQAAYAASSNQVKQELILKLRDPRRVFGEGQQRADGTWDTQRKVVEVAVMQLLEHGFVKNDAMLPEPTDPRTQQPGRQKQAVFNAKTVEMLARYGFAPGSNFGDTMHFDYIQGYSEAVEGGRHGENMKRLRFSPEGEFIPPPKPPKSSGPRAPRR